MNGDNVYTDSEIGCYFCGAEAPTTEISFRPTAKDEPRHIWLCQYCAESDCCQAELYPTQYSNLHIMRAMAQMFHVLEKRLKP